MISESEAIEVWDKIGLDDTIREHCSAVQRLATELATNLIKEGVSIDIELVKMGALLHDVGRAAEHNIKHGLFGYDLLKKHGMTQDICEIAKRHVGAGISEEEAVKLGLPAQNYIPRTLEEKLVAYADNLVDGIKIVPYREVLRNWIHEYGSDSEQVNRLKLLHAELVDFVTTEMCRVMDERAILSGLTIQQLMENAGKGIARTVDALEDVKGKKVVVFAGKGNNGGDALAAAFYLIRRDAKVTVYQLGTPGTNECQSNYDRLKGKVPLNLIVDSEGFGEVKADIILDGLLGTGIRGDIREPVASGMRKINETYARKISIDVPSGMDPDTGRVAPLYIRPDVTITLQKIKRGLVGNKLAGRLEIIDIGIPKEAMQY